MTVVSPRHAVGLHLRSHASLACGLIAIPAIDSNGSRGPEARSLVADQLLQWVIGISSGAGNCCDLWNAATMTSTDQAIAVD